MSITPFHKTCFSPEKLQDAFERFNVQNQFKLGDIVQWKKGLKNAKFTGPFVVIDILEQPVLDEDEDGSRSQYFREQLDCILGFIDSDGDLVAHHYDSRRFEPYKT